MSINFAFFSDYQDQCEKATEVKKIFSQLNGVIGSLKEEMKQLKGTTTQQISQRDAKISDMTRQISERDVLLSERDLLISERDAKIACLLR